MLSRNSEKAQALPLLLGKMVDQGVLILVPQEERSKGFYSHVFVFKMPLGKLCLILNLKPLNQAIRYKKFHMESFFSVKNMFQPRVFMATMDLRDAYLNIPIQEGSQKYLRLAVEIDRKENHIQSRALPFRLPSSPSIFTKVLAKALVPLWLKSMTVVPYLDDLLFVGPKEAQLSKKLFKCSNGWSRCPFVLPRNFVF